MPLYCSIKFAAENQVNNTVQLNNSPPVDGPTYHLKGGGGPQNSIKLDIWLAVSSTFDRLREAVQLLETDDRPNVFISEPSGLSKPVTDRLCTFRSVARSWRPCKHYGFATRAESIIRGPFRQKTKITWKAGSINKKKIIGTICKEIIVELAWK